jgi:hypothetical protein
MKVLIAITLIIGAAFMGWKIYEQWDSVQNKPQQKAAEVAPQVTGTQLPGLPASLEGTLHSSQQLGVSGLRNFLQQYGKTIRDPRLAWIELDYAVLLMRENPAEAKKVFARVKKRTPISSPVYPRIKQLEKSYE